jgi:hypothetical protein
MNVGLGPALRVQITANYIDPEYHAEIQRVTRPAIKPGESDRVQLYVRCPPPLPPSGVRRDGFRVSGTYLDRSRTDEYEIINVLGGSSRGTWLAGGDSGDTCEMRRSDLALRLEGAPAVTICTRRDAPA